MATSYNGWPALPSGSPKLHRWKVPGVDRYFVLREGSAGFLLVFVAHWYHEAIQKLNRKGDPWDEWAYAYRETRGQEGTGNLSNHASATAEDLNASLYPLGTLLMKAWRKAKIIAKMALFRGCVRWGGQYEGRKDQMHFEINRGMRKCERVARRLSKTKRGRLILAHNPGQKRIIFS